MTRRDAVVVGAGPAGSVTALLLARAGARVLLLDRARFPRDKPCSEYLTPETTRVLERLGGGILEAVEASAPARLSGMKIVSPDGTAAVGRFRPGPGYAPPRPYGFALPRTTFDQILVDAAVRAGVELEEETTVEDLIVAGGMAQGAVMREAEGGKREEVRSRVVIGADGLRSVVARRLGHRRFGPPRRVAYSAHVAGVRDVTDVGEMHIGESGYVGMGPIGSGETTVALVVPATSARRELTRPGPFVAALDRFPGLRGRFRADLVTRAVLATGPFAQWSRASTADGALLVGDAADFFDPFTGQGIYSALRGAELAAEALIPALALGTGPIPATRLEAYRKARRRVFGAKWILERLIGAGVGWPALATRVVRRLARRPELADLLVGATGNFIPAARVLSPATLTSLIA